MPLKENFECVLDLTIPDVTKILLETNLYIEAIINKNEIPGH